MKKFFCVFAFVAILGLFAPGLKAYAETKKVIAFGDSLTYGYGVEGNSYAKIYADEKGYSLTNYAEIGMDSTGLLEFLQAENVDCSQADEIILWIGANDLLHALYDYADDKGIDYNNIKNENVENLKNQLNSAEFTAKMNETIKTFGENLAEILSEIKAKGGGRIYLFTQYNPYDGIVAGGINVGAISEKWIKKLNNVVAEQEGVIIVDASFAVKSSQEKCVNAEVDLNYGKIETDPHLTAEGHRVVSEYFAGVAAKADEDAEKTDPSAGNNGKNDANNTAIIIVSSAAVVAAGAGTGAVFVIKKKKTGK